MKDSVNNITQATNDISHEIQNVKYADKLKDLESFEFIFLISVMVITLLSLTKYLVNKRSKKKVWFEFGVELPIDICGALLTIIISTYLSVSLGWGVALLFGIMIVCVVCCSLRNTVIDKSYDSSPKKKSLYWWAILEFVVALSAIGYTYHILSMP